MQFKRKCSCVFSSAQDIMRFEDIVTKEGAVPPQMDGLEPEEWAKRDCPHCRGTGAIIEQALTPREIEAMMNDFKKRMASQR